MPKDIDIIGKGKLRLGGLEISFSLGEGNGGAPALEQLEAARDELLSKLKEVDDEIKRMEG